MATNGKKLIQMPLSQALRAKWEAGQAQYGTEFVGHPLEELDEELIDAINYAEEAQKRGYRLPGIVEKLRVIDVEVRQAYLVGPNESAPARARIAGLLALLDAALEIVEKIREDVEYADNLVLAGTAAALIGAQAGAESFALELDPEVAA